MAEADSTISKWRGECRHEREYEGRKSNYVLYFYKQGYRYRCSKCKKFYVNWPVNTDYTDPSAWTQKLFDKIQRTPITQSLFRGGRLLLEF